MVGRMSSNQAVQNFLSDLQGNYRGLTDAQRTLSTGKRINSPSDDPVGIASGLSIRRDQSATAAWGRNVEDSQTWLNTTDTALAQALDVVQRARELAVQGGNGTLSSNARALIANEVTTLKSQFVEIGNSSQGGRFIFGGTATDTPPFDATAEAATTPINTGAISREVSQGSVMSVNITADRLQAAPGASGDIFAVLDGLATALQTGDSDAIATALNDLDAHQSNISALRGEGAAKINRLELTASRFDSLKIASGEQLSKIEDADMAQAITDLSMRETVYNAALATGARVIQKSLVDFLQ